MENGERTGVRGEVGRDLAERWRVGCDRSTFDGEERVPQNARKKKPIRSCGDLDVFNLAYVLDVGAFRMTAGFPREGRCALVDQMRRSSRGACGDITERFAKRRYTKVFKNALSDSLGESEETKLRLDSALDYGYIPTDKHQQLTTGYRQTSAMRWTLMTRWEDFR